MNVQKIKQSKPILQLKFPTRRPDKGEFDYRESQLLTKATKIFPDWDKARHTIDVDVVTVKRELREAEENLKKTRLEAKERYAANDSMWAELTKKQLDLRRSFLKFHSFVRENEDKRIRAAKKIIEEKEMQQKRTQMIKETEEMCACLAKTKGQFEAKIKDYRIYEDYLVGVSNIPGELFHGVNDIIKRYESLKEAKEVIRLKRLIEMDELDNAKSRLVKMIERKSQALIEMNSKVVDLICRHDSAKDCSLRWENIVAAIKERTQMKQAEIDGVKLCTWNIYTQMCARKTEAPSLKRSDFEGQLMHIKKTLQELRTVQKIVAKQCVNYTGVKREKKDRREQATNRKFAHKNSQYVTNVKMRSNFLSLFDPVKNPLNKI